MLKGIFKNFSFIFYIRTMVSHLVDMCVKINLPIDAMTDPDFFSIEGIIRIVRSILQANSDSFNYSFNEQ